VANYLAKGQWCGRELEGTDLRMRLRSAGICEGERVAAAQGRTQAAAKGDGRKCPKWWEYSLAAINQTTTRMHRHGHHEGT
jgi:hypothetical protein